MRKYIIPSAFFAVMYVFFGIIHPEWLNFQEQYQMFLFGWDYLADHLSVPSGVADYLGEFVVQFFYYPLLGGLLWAAMLTCMGVLSNMLASRISGSSMEYPSLGFLIPTLVAVYCGDENVIVAFPMALLLALLSAWGYSCVGIRSRIYLNIAIIPVLYWLIGYGALLYIPLAVAIDHRYYSFGIVRSAANLLAGVLIWLGVMLVVYRFVLVQYPLIDLACGANFYRENIVIPSMQHWITALSVLVILLMHRVPARKWLHGAISGAVVMAVMYWGCLHTYDRAKYSSFYVDYLVRNQQWEKVISYCEGNPPYTNVVSNGLNLSLYMTGQLAERMFQFPQNGQEGILDKFEVNMFSATISAETCYHLALVNNFLRINFDSQESILNSCKSGRFTRRIAEGFLLNGNYEVAEKYIDLLSRTMFYRNFAREFDACVKDPSRINRHTRWVEMRQNRMNTEMLYATSDLSGMLVFMYKKRPTNRMALEYALCIDILNCNIDHFLDCFLLSQGGDINNVQNVPRVYQEVIAFVLYRRTGSLNNMPYFISADVLRDLDLFIRSSMTNPDSEIMRTGRLSKTFWRYISIMKNRN